MTVVRGCVQIRGGLDPERNYIRPPPLPPISPRRPFSERWGGGVYTLKPPAAGFYTPPLFYTPPTPRRVFSGVGGGWGCIKFGPVLELTELYLDLWQVFPPQSQPKQELFGTDIWRSFGCPGPALRSGPSKPWEVGDKIQGPSFRQEKGTQTQTFWSGYSRVGWGSSTWTGGGQKVRYVPRNQGNQTFWAGYPGILPGYPGIARKVGEKKVRVQFPFPIAWDNKRDDEPLLAPPGTHILSGLRWLKVAYSGLKVA